MKNIAIIVLLVGATGCADLNIGESRNSGSAQAGSRPLACATAEEVGAYFATDFNTKLDEALEGQTIRHFTRTNAEDVGYELEEVIVAMLDLLGQQQANVRVIRDYADDFAIAQTSPRADANGCVTSDIAPSLLFYATEELISLHSTTRAQQPTGINLETLRQDWLLFSSNTGYDSSFLRPALVGVNANLKEIRDAVGARGTMTSWGTTAVDDFAAAPEGPAGDRGFKKIADAVRGQGVLKRFYFQDGDTDPNSWSSNQLVVLDEHGQAWGFSMGYSE